MNVLHLTTSDGPFFSQLRRELETRGIDCTTLRVPGGDDGRRSVREYVAFYRSVLGTVAVEQFDLVHANYGLLGPPSIAQPVRPLVLSLWGSDVYGSVAPISRLSSRLADETIVMSAEMARMVGNSPWVVPHGTDLERFRPQPRSEALSAVGWNPAHRHVLFPYHPSRPEKNYPRAERIVERARARFDEPIELHAVHGVAHDRMPDYMNAADVLLLTSTHEGSPNAVREALACNCPVVATDVGDVRDRLDEADAVSVHDADSDLSAALVRTLDGTPPTDGREVVRPYGLDRTTDAVLTVYESACGRSLNRFRSDR